MIHYRLSQERDMESVIDFINMVFSMLRVPHNFETMLPKVYGKKNRQNEIHVIAEDEEGRLCGCLAMNVFPLRIAGRTIRVGYLGSMAVHPRVRGQGTMGTLMQKQIDRGFELGLDMMVLGGQRQRYQYSGFETGGATICYSISRANVRHALADQTVEGFSFREMNEDDVPRVFALYDRQIVAGARTPENFIDSLRSYHRLAWTIEKDGEPVGYLSASSDGQTIGEIILAEEKWILPALKAWFESKSLKLAHIDAAPYDTVLNGMLSPICEGFSMTPNCMIRVLKPETVLEAYLSLKHTVEPLLPGELILGWEALGNYHLSVGEQGIGVQKTDAAPQVTLTGIEMHQLLFGYNRFAAPKMDVQIPMNWFPLPVHIPHPDSF